MKVRVRYAPGSLERVKRVIRDVNPGVIQAVYINNAETAEQIFNLAQNWAPRDTGALMESIKVTGPGETPPAYSQGLGRPGRGRNKTALGPGDYVVSVGNSAVRYAHLVEFGTAPHINAGIFPGTSNPGTRARPFFWPAVRAVSRTAKKRLQQKVQAAIKRAKRA